MLCKASVPEKQASDPDFKTESLPFVARGEVCNLTNYNISNFLLWLSKHNYKNDVCIYLKNVFVVLENIGWANIG